MLSLESLEPFCLWTSTSGRPNWLPLLVVTLKSVDKGEEEMGFQPRGGSPWLVTVGCAGGGCVFEADEDDGMMMFG